MASPSVFRCRAIQTSWERVVGVVVPLELRGRLCSRCRRHLTGAAGVAASGWPLDTNPGRYCHVLPSSRAGDKATLLGTLSGTLVAGWMRLGGLATTYHVQGTNHPRLANSRPFVRSVGRVDGVGIYIRSPHRYRLQRRVRTCLSFHGNSPNRPLPRALLRTASAEGKGTKCRPRACTW
jgi:hypothetical protein